MTTVFAARYAVTAPSAADRFSSAGWMFAERSADRARSEFLTLRAGCDCGECRTCRTAAEAFEDEYRVAERDGVYFVERFGLSAFVAETEDEAVEAAQADDRFDTLPLWVFEAEVVSDDEDTGVYGGNVARVLVIGPVRRVN